MVIGDPATGADFTDAGVTEAGWSDDETVCTITGCCGFFAAGFCCPDAPAVISSTALMVDFQVLMMFTLSSREQSLSIRKLKNDVYDRGRIRGRAIARRWFELNFVGRCDGGFVQAVTEAPHHAIYVQLPICSKQNF